MDPRIRSELERRLAAGEITQTEFDRLLAEAPATPMPAGSQRGRTTAGLTVERLTEGQVLRDKYEVEKLLGRGGMGVVYLATDRMLQRHVALKVLPQEFAQQPEAVDRFRREALLTMDLHHENIVAVSGFETEGELAFIVMEYIDGPTFSSMLNKVKGPLELRSILSWGAQACAGMAYAHRKGILHRDIKPANLMIHGPEEVLKITDFGLAMQLRMQLTKLTGQHLSGTPLYLAPEVYMGAKPTVQSDVYALAMTLYECLGGEHPWIHAMELRHLVCEVMPEPLPRVPDEVNRALLKGLAKDPALRFASADELGRALWAACEKCPTSSRTRTYLAIPDFGDDTALPADTGVPDNEGTRVVTRARTTQSIEVEVPTESAPRKPRRWVPKALFAAAVIAVAVLAFVFGREKLFPSNAGKTVATPTSSQLQMPTVQVPADMVTVDAGVCRLGCTIGIDSFCKEPSETPFVFLPAFAIQRREVTVGEYRACVEGGRCTAPSKAAMGREKCNWLVAKGERESHPMNCVTLEQARQYCESRGWKLPSDNHWEAAARGPNGYVYPWGNGLPSCSLARMKGCGDGTAPAGQARAGDTASGLSDMSGNVYEWTDNGHVRGGGWQSTAKTLRSSWRYRVNGGVVAQDVGFRCALWLNSWLGVIPGPDEAGHGIAVAAIFASGGAAEAGVRPGDIITEVSGVALSSAADLAVLEAALPVGERVSISLLRDGTPTTVLAKLIQAPEFYARRNFADEILEKMEDLLLGLTWEMRESIDDGLPLPPGVGRTIKTVFPESPAAKLGLKAGDVLLAAAGQAFNEGGNPTSLYLEEQNRSRGLTVARDGRIETIDVAPVAYDFEILKTVVGFRSVVKNCYVKKGEEEPALYRTRLLMSIDAAGQLDECVLANVPDNNVAIGSCICKGLKTVQYPRPPAVDRETGNYRLSAAFNVPQATKGK